MKRALPLLAAAALCVSCGRDAAVEEEEALEPSPLPVTASTVVRDTLFQVVEATGRISSARVQDFVSQIQGVVSRAPERAGLPLSRGQVVFSIAAGE